MLSERNKRKNNTIWSHLYVGSKQKVTTNLDSYWELDWGRRREWEILIRGYKFPVISGENSEDVMDRQHGDDS